MTVLPFSEPGLGSQWGHLPKSVDPLPERAATGAYLSFPFCPWPYASALLCAAHILCYASRSQLLSYDEITVNPLQACQLRNVINTRSDESHTSKHTCSTSSTVVRRRPPGRGIYSILSTDIKFEDLDKLEEIDAIPPSHPPPSLE